MKLVSSVLFGNVGSLPSSPATGDNITMYLVVAVISVVVLGVLVVFYIRGKKKQK